MGRGALDGGVIIGTAGHIDHGKTALVKALTGVDTDRLPEEKRRGITVELGFAPIDLGDGVTASVIDVPGHEGFVKTMVAGAAGIDVALLVVAADEGVMPQTREHLAILDLLEIPRLVVALTKSDLVDAEWLALVTEEVSAQLADSRWKSPPIIACSSVTGQGIGDLRSVLSSAAPKTTQPADDLFRLPVDRCFTIKGTGTVVTGTVWSGTLTPDSSVRILPAGISARVRRIQTHGHDASRVEAGDRSAIALAGMEVADIPRGSALVTDSHWAPSTSLDVRVTVLNRESARIDAESELRFHLAGADVGAKLILPAGDVPADGESFFARLRLDAPVAARGGDRFVLRLPAPVGTIGGGVILDPYPGTRSINKSRALFPADAPDPGARLRAIITYAAGDGLAVDDLPVRIGVSVAQIQSLLGASSAEEFEGRAYSTRALETAKEKILATLSAAEKTFPLQEGVQFESATSAAGCSRDLARLAVARLVSSGELVVNDSLVHRAGWKPSFTNEQKKTIETLAHAICFGGKEPPSASELAEKYGGDVPVFLRYLEREGRVVKVGADRFYARDVVAALVEKLRTDLEAGSEYGPSQLRETLGFSRKYLIPFLEYCDRSGITERKGDGRSLKTMRSNLDTDVAES